jgi:hypothetical protein
MRAGGQEVASFWAVVGGARDERMFVYSADVSESPINRRRYVVHFADGGSGMRWYDQPLAEAGTLADAGVDYVVTRVDQPSRSNGLGYAWAQPLEAETAHPEPSYPARSFKQ